MFFWSSFLDLIRVVLFSLAHVCGGSLGGGIIMLSLLVRLALLPLTLRLALRAREHQAVLRGLEPQLAALKKRHAEDPLALARAQRDLHAANCVGIMPKGSLLGTMVQIPIGAGVYEVIWESTLRAARFHWYGYLSRPDALVASVAAGLAGAAVVAGPSSGSSKVAAALAAATTFLIAWRLSAGVGLYWMASNVVGVVQSLLVRRAVAGTEKA